MNGYSVYISTWGTDESPRWNITVYRDIDDKVIHQAEDQISLDLGIRIAGKAVSNDVRQRAARKKIKQ